MKEKFETIYETDTWGNGSGVGSLADNTIGYRNFLQTFMRERGIKSVVDIGCGDWQFSKLINWDGIDYTGIDIVKSVVDSNTAKYGKDNIHFRQYDALPDELPKADLLIMKDVLQHWSNESIIKFLPRLSAYGYSLLTDCHLNWTENGNIEDGQMRVLDIRREPFNLDAELVYAFTNDNLQKDGIQWEKYTYLHKGINVDKALTTDGWMNPRELEWLAVQAKLSFRTLELGSYAGRSTRAICDNTSGYVTSVDNWTGEIKGIDLDKVYNEYVFNLFDHHTSGTLKSFRQTTDTALDWFINHDLKFDFIFIDASHDYEQVRNDILSSLKLLTPGGIISGHDFGIWEGVTKAVNELLPESRFVSSIWYWRKD